MDLGLIVTRDDIVRNLVDKQRDLSYKVMSLAVKRMLQFMSLELSKGTRIEVRGFGSFSLRHRDPRLSRNPRTGEQVQTSGKYVVHFKPGKELKGRVDNACKDAS